MLIYYTELTIDEGFEVLDKKNKEDRLLKGRRVSACSGWPLFQALKGKPIKCYCCGVEADRWIADQSPNNHVGYPVVNLYALRDDQIVLMNRDHIIPKSLGGVDEVENLRPACEVCNGSRGNSLTPEELQFRKDHPHLISQSRLKAGQENARKAIRLHRSEEERARIAEPFDMIGEPL